MARRRQPIVIALGGNALKVGSDMLDYPGLPQACRSMAACAGDGLVVTHGNGPQVGRLAATRSQADWPLDVLGAETEGMLGYILEQELGNHLRADDGVVSLLTRTEVDPDDERFSVPAKPIGDWIGLENARELASTRGWTFREKDGKYQRLVASPLPKRTLQRDAVEILVNAGITVICAGGGGVPVICDRRGKMRGVEAVVDKDLTSAMLGAELGARKLVLVTDVNGVYEDWEGKAENLIAETSPDEISQLDLPRGSMGAKVDAACRFARSLRRPAVIGALGDLAGLIAGKAGTRIEWRASPAV